MINTFFISDMHFGHFNIIKYENRPFADVKEMDKTIINNWNNIVKRDDLVFILGDVSFYNTDKTFQIVSQLKGRKKLVIGNHDKSRSIFYWEKMGFVEVSNYSIIYNNFYILSHEPVYMSPNMPYVNIHGHLHGKKLVTLTEKIQQHVNVSVECINYTPINFNTIISNLENGDN